MVCLDLSNYSAHASAATVAATELVIIQAVLPPPGYPPSETRAQLQAAQAAGVPADVYYFLFAGQSDAVILSHLSLTDGFSVRKKWLDIEESGLSVRYIAHVLSLLDAQAATYPIAGIYAAAWWDAQNRGVLDSFSATRQLWCAQYDNVADANVFTPFAGWAECRIKQYRGTSTWNGITNVDLNALSDREVTDLPGQKGVPVAIHVGAGMIAQLNANNDSPLCDHINYTDVDDDGLVYNVEKVLGSKGLYVSANPGGVWTNAGPM